MNLINYFIRRYLSFLKSVLLFTFITMTLMLVAYAFGIPKDVSIHITVAIVFVIVTLVSILPLLRIKMNRPCRMHATRTIGAPIETVWRAINVSPRTDLFHPQMREIKSVDGSKDQFDLITECKTYTGKIITLTHRAKVEVSSQNEELVMVYTDFDCGPSLIINQLRTRFHLSETTSGTLVEYDEYHSNTHAGLWLYCFFNIPAKSYLRSLNAFCTNVTDKTKLAKKQRLDELAEKAGLNQSRVLADAAALIAVLYSIRPIMTAIVFGIKQLSTAL